ncbi:MAG: DUF1232 domain-containing protein [Roseiflexaceae bacterium]|nr:DUF1232 domain-containing protein [Roseiflexaceae bacterium]
MLQTWRLRVQALKRETYALYLAARDPRTPWYARLVVGLVVAYAFSPIDLIPDFIPVLGLLDDLVLVPLGIALAIKLIPAPILAESRQRSIDAFASGKPISRAAAVVIVCIWIGLAVLGIIAMLRAWP